MRIICKDEKLIPKYESADAACMDLKLAQDVVIPPRKSVKVGTGVFVEIPKGFYGEVVPRSSTGDKMLALANTVGYIDSDYRGEIILNIFNRDHHHSFLGYKYDRLFQLAVKPVIQVDLEVCDSLDVTSRGEGRYGSTG